VLKKEWWSEFLSSVVGALSRPVHHFIHTRKDTSCDFQWILGECHNHPDYDPENIPHLAVFVYFMSGKNDDNLVWPFRGKVKVTLLNQLEDKNHWEAMN